MSQKALLPVPQIERNETLQRELVTTELRYFADRSLYDALSTLYVRAGVHAKRFTRNYTLESVQAAAIGSPYELCPDNDEVSAVPEYAVAALYNIVQGHWEPFYSGIRDSYVLVNKETNNVEVYLDLQTSENNGIVNIVAFGLIKSCNYLLQCFQQQLRLKVERSAQRIELAPDGSLSTSAITLADPAKYQNNLYPNVPCTPKELLDSWLESDARCLVLYGPAGGGKSSYVSQMLVHLGYAKVAIVDSTNVSTHPSIVNAVRDLPNGSTVIFEDADILMSARADGNKLMSELLNVISGVAERDIRFVFLTNLPTLKSIDTALLRPGRCHRALEFRMFTRSEVNTVRAGAGLSDLSDLELEAKSEWTLADIIYAGEDNLTKKATGFGLLANV